MKAIRIQIDMLYQVTDEEAEDIFNEDVGFFKGVEEHFNSWSENKDDPRDPVDFDLRYHMGPVIDDTKTDES